jgi:hypothetical protein
MLRTDIPSPTNNTNIKSQKYILYSKIHVIYLHENMVVARRIDNGSLFSRLGHNIYFIEVSAVGSSLLSQNKIQQSRISIQLSTFWTLSIVLSFIETHHV